MNVYKITGLFMILFVLLLLTTFAIIQKDAFLLAMIGSIAMLLTLQIGLMLVIGGKEAYIDIVGYWYK